MQLQTIYVLIVVCCGCLSLAQRPPRPTGGPGDPFAFRRLFHPLAEQRMMSSLGLNFNQPNLATMSLLFDMELPDALLLSAMSGGRGVSPARARMQAERNPFLVALGILDGADRPDPRQRRGRGGNKGGRRRRPGGPNRRPPRPSRRGGGRTEAGPRGASEAGPGGAGEAGPA